MKTLLFVLSFLFISSIYGQSITRDSDFKPNELTLYLLNNAFNEEEKDNVLSNINLLKAVEYHLTNSYTIIHVAQNPGNIDIRNFDHLRNETEEVTYSDELTGLIILLKSQDELDANFDHLRFPQGRPDFTSKIAN